MDTYNTSSQQDITNYADPTSIELRISSSNAPYAKPDSLESNLKSGDNTNNTPTVIVKKKRGNIANLKPYKAGAEWKGNAKGKPKGIRQIKDLLRTELSKEDTKIIARTIIDGAKIGEDKKIDTLLKLTGDLSNDNTQVTVNNNSLLLNDEIIEAARQYLKDKENTVNIKQIE